ncbi:thiamine-phosphate kinase [Paucidesulfovibrio longus]|uniref:thiamine-phosphate kinase n=1 Tax=Paucidesulfovibrio longus TaxID=889 RepID=UPI0003B3D26C|nr:thiamine-phosphate kinase [Paucidesulfovibrio longus]
MPPHSEEDFLELIDRYFPNVPDTVLLGRGDDCCIIPRGSDICLSTDLFLDTVHFRRSYFQPEEIGYKALAVNVSDIAGMGAAPRGFTLELMIPDGLPADFWPRFFSGMSELAAEHELALVGGDLSRSPFLGIGMTIWGEPGRSGRLLTRGNARPGDLIFVVGEIGMARVGLSVLESLGHVAREEWPQSVGAHLRPRPRVAEGLALADLPEVRGCMDISDGLARDLPRFLALSQGYGADLDLHAYRYEPELLRLALQLGEIPAMTVLLGGEDYGLLGACAPEGKDALLNAVPGVAIVGVVSEEPGIRLDHEPLTAKGFDHFSG